MEEYAIHDQKLIDALWESGIMCLRVDDEHNWFAVDLSVEQREEVSLPNGMRVVRFGTGLHLEGRVFLEHADTPDKWYRDCWIIDDPLLPGHIRKAGYMCNCVAIRPDGRRMYEVNFYVSLRKECQLSRTLTIQWVGSNQIGRKL